MQTWATCEYSVWRCSIEISIWVRHFHVTHTWITDIISIELTDVSQFQSTQTPCVTFEIIRAREIFLALNPTYISSYWFERACEIIQCIKYTFWKPLKRFPCLETWILDVCNESVFIFLIQVHFYGNQIFPSREISNRTPSDNET